MASTRRQAVRAWARSGGGDMERLMLLVGVHGRGPVGEVALS
jgi:hypothetical protein